MDSAATQKDIEIRQSRGRPMIEIAIGIFFAALDERKKKERNQQQQRQRAHRQEHTGSGTRTAGGDPNFHNR